MFYQTSMGLIYLIFNQLPFLWDTSENGNIMSAKLVKKFDMANITYHSKTDDNG